MAEPNASGGYERILVVLDRLATERHSTGWGVRELAEAVDETRSGVNRVLQALVDVGLAERTEGATYRSGPRLKVLADRVLCTHPLMAAAPEILGALSTQTESTTILAVHDSPRAQCFVAANHSGPGPVRYHLEPATTLPLHAGAAGQAILSQLGTAALDTDLMAYTSDTVVDLERLTQMLEQTRRRGYSLSIGQHFPLAAGIAVPLHAHGLLAAISVTRSRYNTDTDDLVGFEPLITRAAHELASAATPASTSRADNYASAPFDDDAARTGGGAGRVERFITALLHEPGGLPGVGRELGRLICANRATATKVLDAATSCSITVQKAGRYVAGPKLLHWAAALGPITHRAEIARSVVSAVAGALGEAVGLIEYDRDRNQAILTLVAEGPAPLQYGLATGVEMPLHAGAAGKAILAYLDDHVVDQLELHPHTDRTITTTSALRQSLRTVKQSGWAIGDGEHIPDAFGIAVPYFVDGTVAGSLTATLPRFRMQTIDIDDTASMLRQAAQRITALLSV